MKVFCVLLCGVAAVIAAPKIDPNVELRKNINREYINSLMASSAFDSKIK